MRSGDVRALGRVRGRKSAGTASVDMFRRAASDVLKWILWNPVRGVMRYVPYGAVNRIGIILGRIYCLVPTGKRRAVERNLANVTGGKRSDAGELTRKWFINKFRVRMDFFKFPAMKKENLHAYVSSIEGSDALDRALEKGRGAILLTGHYGSNQLVPCILTLKGYSLTQLGFRVPPENGSFVERNIYKVRMRIEESSFRSFYTGGFMREVFTLLRKNEVLIMTGDGRQGQRNSFVEMPFMKRKACFPSGPYLLAAKTGAPLLPAINVREPDGRYRLIIREPLELDSTGDRDADVKSSCARFLQFYEGYIWKHPDHWHFWDRFSDGAPLGF